MEELGEMVQVVEVTSDLAFKAVGMPADLVKMLANAVHYMEETRREKKDEIRKDREENIREMLLKGGETPLEYLARKDGTVHVFQFPEEKGDAVLQTLEAYKISYTSAPDLNIRDGLREVFVSGTDLDRVTLLSEKLKLGETKDLEDWLEGASPEMKQFLADQEKENAEEGLERFAVTDFSINESINEGIKEENYVIRIPGTWNQEGGPSHVHIPKAYAMEITTDNRRTLLLRVPSSLQCKVVDGKGQESLHPASEIHKQSFSDTDRFEQQVKSVQDYAGRKKAAKDRRNGMDGKRLQKVRKTAK